DVLLQDSGSNENSFHTPVVVKKELKPGAQLKSLFITDFGSSSEPIEKLKKIEGNRKVKGLFPFSTDLFAKVNHF
ncbi:hypothetical protein PanWU01x14_222730, partial [Parasponia andersonii]